MTYYNNIQFNSNIRHFRINIFSIFIAFYQITEYLFGRGQNDFNDSFHDKN